MVKVLGGKTQRYVSSTTMHAMCKWIGMHAKLANTLHVLLNSCKFIVTPCKVHGASMVNLQQQSLPYQCFQVTSRRPGQSGRYRRTPCLSVNIDKPLTANMMPYQFGFPFGKPLFNSRFPFIPAMAVSAEIKTSKRRVIDYFLSPLIQHGSESLHER